MNVYVLQHVRPSEDGDEGDVKMIDVHSSKQMAQAAVRRLSELPGFNKYPDGFETIQYELDKDHYWIEGFGIVVDDDTRA